MARLLLLAISTLMGSIAIRAQTIVPPENTFAFAVPRDFAMEAEGTVRVMVVRATGTRGKISVDVGVKADTAKVVDPGFTGTTLVFNDYQLSATFDLPIVDIPDPNALSVVTLELKNPALLPGQNASLTPTILAGFGETELNVVDDDDPLTVSFEKFNYVTAEGGSISVTVKLGAPADPADLANISATYTIRAPQDGEQHSGADLASVGGGASDVDAGAITGTLTFNAQGTATINIATIADRLLEYNEEFIIELTDVSGDADDPDSEDAMDRLDYTLGALPFARGRILFSTNVDDPMPAGAVDQQFNPDNLPPTRLRNPGANGPVTAVAVDVNKNYYVAGNFSAVNAILRSGLARLTSTGAVDPAFTPSQNINGAVTSMDVYLNGPQAGKVVIGGGFSSVNGQPRSGIARYLSNGTLDPNFAIGLGAANGPVYTVKVALDNSLYIGGNFTSFDGVARGRIAHLLPDGRLDTSMFNGVGANGPVYDLNIAPLSAITLSNAGVNETNFVVTSRSINARLGLLDLTFDTGMEPDIFTIRFGNTVIFDGLLTNAFNITTNIDGDLITNSVPASRQFDLGQQPSAPNNLQIIVTPRFETNQTSWNFRATVTPAGAAPIVAVGDFTEFDGVPVSHVVKLTTTGTVDGIFASNIGTGASGTVQAVDAQSDGSYIIVGSFPTFNSQIAGGIARLSSLGEPDADFASGTGANGRIRDVFVDRATDASRRDRIYIAGDFTVYNSSRRIFLARLHPDGFLDTGFMDSSYNQFAGFPNATGLAPNGTLGSVTVDKDGGVFVGGIFDLVGGGSTRDAFKPRQNFARLLGGRTPGPGNVTLDAKEFGADEDGGVLVGTLTVVDTIQPFQKNGLILLNTVDASAVAGEDYVDSSGVYALDKPSPDYFFEIPLVDDDVIEGDEDFLMRIDEVAGFKILGGEIFYPEMALGAITVASARILENDVPPAVFSFSQPEYNVDENRGTATVEVYRTGNISDAVTVLFSATVSGGPNAASAPDDFIEVIDFPVNFSSGVTNATVTVEIRDDQIVEVDETLALTLSGASTGSIVDPLASSAILNIVDNDLPAGKIDFGLGGFTVVEGQPNAIITVGRSGGNLGFITIEYETVEGTAKQGTDYLTSRGRLSWNDKDISTRTILIPIQNDGLVESAETFTLRLVNPSQAGIVGTRHPTTTVTINDNDFYGELQFSEPQYFTDENGVAAIIQVIRRNGNAENVRVNYSTAPGSVAGTAAVPGKDYDNVSGVLVFAPGETAKSFVVPIRDDSEADGTRVVRLTLSAPLNGQAGTPGTLGANATADLSIIDNELQNIPAGGVDTDFISTDGANGPVNVVALHSDAQDGTRKILIAGEFTQYNHILRDKIAQLNNDGTLDRNFANNTRVNGAIRALSVLPDGAMMIAGHFTEVDATTINYVARLNRVGHLDTLFKPGAGPDNIVFALAQTFAGNPADNLQRIVIGGDFVNYDSVPRQRIAVVRPDGTLDPAFDPGLGPDSTVFAIAVQRDQKILIGGDFLTVAGVPRAHLARLNVDGSLDLSFDPLEGFDSSVRSITIQADDKILVGGDFTTYNQTPRSRVTRLNIDGSNDASFNIGSGADGTVNSIALQTDGKIVLGGDFANFNGAVRRSVVRLLPSGTVDLSINFGAGPNEVVNSVAIQSDRGILIGGDFTEVDGFPRNRVARMFGGSLAGAGALEFATPIFTAIESEPNAIVEIRRIGGLEGTISATYETGSITATPGEDYLNVTNTVTFQPGEILKTVVVPLLNDFQPEENEFVSIQLRDPVGGVLGRQPVATIEIISDDSKISFSSGVYTVNENAPGNRANITLVREGVSVQPIALLLSTSDGTATAGSDYTAVSTQVNFGANEITKVVSIPISDDLDVEGNETVNLQISLVSQDPSVTLGTASAVLTIADNDTAPGALAFTGETVAAEGSGSIVLTVTRTAGKLGTVSVNYATEDGTARAPGDYSSRSGTLTFQQTDTTKTIVIPIANDSEVEGNENFRVRLSNPTGGAVLGANSVATVVIVDNDFGPGSLDQNFDVGVGATGTVYSIVLQPDGKIVVGGDFTDFNASGHPKLVRLNPSGSVDGSFFAGAGPAGTIYSLALDTAGRITLGGDFRSFNSVDRLYLTRVTSGGGLDPSMSESAELNNFVRALVRQPDGNLVIGGAFTTPALRAARITASGSMDPSFNLGSVTGPNADVLDVALEADGKVILGGLFTQVAGISSGRVVRLLPTGLIDSTFNTSVGANNAVRRVVALPDGKTLIAGDFTQFNGEAAIRVVRLNSNGSIDQTFTHDVGPNGSVYAMAVQKDGKILIGGDFATVNGLPRNRVARLNANGGLDETFKPGLGPNGRVYDIEVQSDNNILIAGAFTEMNGFPRAGIARINGLEPAVEFPLTVTRDASQLQVTFQSVAGYTYDLQASRDLVTWNTIQTIQPSGGPATFTVAIPTTADYQFFQVIQRAQP